jgi:hypothetical protein
MPFRRDDAVRDRQPGGGGERAARGEPRSAAEQVLALQRSAGNQAVSGMLARAPDTKEKAAAGPTAKVGDIGTIPIDSVSLDVGRLAGAGGAGTKRDEPPKELTLTSLIGKHSADLQKAAIDGTAMDVEIRIPHGKTTVVITVKNAMVSSYNASGERESWQLNAQSISHAIEGEESGSSESGAEKK